MATEAEVSFVKLLVSDIETNGVSDFAEKVILALQVTGHQASLKFKAMAPARKKKLAQEPTR